MYDIIIIGAGPAGTAAAVYAARKRLKTLLITESFGGQSIVSDGIENWIGERHITGFDLAKKFEEHVRAFSDIVDIVMPEIAIEVREIPCVDGKRACDFEVRTDKGKIYSTKAVIVAAGARRRKLGVPGEKEYDGKGVAYCSTCDAPLFAGKAVAVVGGGNAGLEAVVDLFPYATHIDLLVRGDALKGDPVTQEEVKKNEKVNIIYQADTKEIQGDTMVTGLTYVDGAAHKEKKLDVQGVFVEIGSVPNSDIVKGLVELDAFKQIKIDSKTSATSHPGIFAAGDITDDPFKQNNISAGDGVKAALSAYAYILNLKKKSPAEDKNNNGNESR